MPNSELGRQILAENEALRREIEAHTKAMNDLAERVEEAEDTGKHTRWFAYVIAAAVVIIVLGVGWLRISLIQQYQEDACRAANASRALENKLWTDLIAADTQLEEKAGNKISKAERDAIEQIKANVAAAYPQRDCAEVKDGNVVNITPAPSPTAGGNDE
jgi:hypothetical protein